MARTRSKKMNLQPVLAGAVGGAVANFAGPMIPVDKPVPRNAIVLGLGIALAMSKNAMMQSAGIGMAGVGAGKLVYNFLDDANKPTNARGNAYARLAQARAQKMLPANQRPITVNRERTLQPNQGTVSPDVNGVSLS
jgi:hypothetical protein